MIEKLEILIKSCNTLEEIVNAFFDVVEGTKGEVEYVAGTLPAIYMQLGCKFMLVHSTELEDGEFYQISMDVHLDAEDKVYPYDHKLYDENDGDLRKYILESDLFAVLKNMVILDVDVYDAET